MSRLFFIVAFSYFSLSMAFADACVTGDMTIPHKCTNISCTETETVGISRNTSGGVRAILSGQKNTVNIDDQNVSVSDYCNQPVLTGQNLSCRSLGTTKTINGWKRYTGKIYRVVSGRYYLYDNGIDLLNQRIANSTGPNDPLQISIGNICTTLACTSTQEQSYSVFSTNSITRYSGSVSSFTMQGYDMPVITSAYADESRKTNNAFLYGASFTDRIPQGCTNSTYTYNPKVLTWNGGNLITEFTDSNTNGNTHIVVNRIGENVTGSITEGITLGQTGLRKIEINITDAGNNTGTRTTGMMEVIQGDINQNNSSIASQQNTSAKYYPGDTLIYTVILKDAAGNIIKDKPATFMHPTQDSSITYLDPQPIYSDANTGEYTLRISISEPLSFIENFHARLPYWNDQGANITAGSPQDIVLGNGSRIAIRDPNLAASDFIIPCSKGPITLKAVCVRDNLSGCNPAGSESITFSSESDNGAEGLLKSRDNAGNIKQYRYIMNHIDTTAPTGIPKIGNIDLVNNMSVLATNSHLSLAVNDVRPPGCGPSIAYTLLRPDRLGTGVFNFAGTIQVGRTLDFGTTNFTKNSAGQVVYTLTDIAGNRTTGRRNITIHPGYPSVVNSSISLVNPSSNSTYANSSDTYTYKLTLKDLFNNPIYGKSVTNMNQEGGLKTIKTDMANPGSPTGNDAVSEQWVGGINTTNNNGEATFTVKSLAPGVFSEKFKISMHTTWDSNYQDTGAIQDIFIGSENENSFRKTFTGGLSITTSPYKLTLGTALTMQLGITQKSTISSYNIGQFKDALNSTIGTQEVQDKQDALSLNNNPLMDFRIEATDDAGANILPGISIQGNPVISYMLGGQNIRYRLSATDSATDATNISLGGSAVNGTLKIVGALQGQGKQSLVGQKSNFSDISKSDMRAIIRKNAYMLIRGMNSGQIINGVKYIEGNITLSGEPSYETLLVKNGNLTITNNFNTGGKKFGIIVLRDDATKTNLGNIYLQPNVQYIQSAVYADGGIISTGFGNDTIGNYKDSAMRTNTLSGQLVINGALFTRNTIGGAIRGSSGKYVLPGGSATSDFNLAMMYDLNYLRRGNEGQNINYNKGNIDNVVIISNPNLQKDPPKGFRN